MRFSVKCRAAVIFLWVAHAVWPPWGCDREKHDRHSLGACTIQMVTVRFIAFGHSTAVYVEKGCHDRNFEITKVGRPVWTTGMPH